MGLRRDRGSLSAPSRQAEDVASGKMARVEFLRRYHVTSCHTLRGSGLAPSASRFPPAISSGFKLRLGLGASRQDTKTQSRFSGG